MGNFVSTGRNTTLKQKVNAGDANTIITLDGIPWAETTGIVEVSTGSNKEWWSFTGQSGDTITGVVTGFNQDATSMSDFTTANKNPHAVGTVVRLVNHSIDINNKAILDGANTFTGTQTFNGTQEFTDSDVTIRRDGSDLKLKDLNNSEKTLSQLAAAGGDEKVSISANDTTPSFLISKTVGGKAITQTEQNDGGNETLLYDLDQTDTDAFVSTSAGAGDSGKSPLLNGSGQLDPSFVNAVSELDFPLNYFNGSRVTLNDYGDKTTTTGTGSIVTAGMGIVHLLTGSTSGSLSQTANTLFTIFGDVKGRNPDYFSRCIFDETTDQDAFIGWATATPVNNVLTFNHAAFFLADNTMVASVANGSTQTVSSTLTVTITNTNEYRILGDGTNYKFFINGSEVADLSTNIPSSITQANVGIKNSASAIKGIFLAQQSISFDE